MNDEQFATFITTLKKIAFESVFFISGVYLCNTGSPFIGGALIVLSLVPEYPYNKNN